MSDDIEFVPGLFVKEPHPNAPDFVKMGMSIKVKDLGNFLREKNKAGDEWVNIDVKESRGGKWYASVSNFKPTKQEPASNPPPDDFDDLPF
jgi:translation initiation factor 1 (eIF-1/SUI1)